jgi:hypothetical protein
LLAPRYSHRCYALLGLIITPLAAAAILAGPAMANVTKCDLKDGIPPYFAVSLWAENVDDIPGLCGGFLGNLHGRGCSVTGWYCQGEDASNILNAEFQVDKARNYDDIEAAWYASTGNGEDINCTG